METGVRRRAVLAGLASLLAGCAGDGNDARTDGSGGTSESPPSESPPSATTSAGDDASDADGAGLDLREANVTGVAVESSGDGGRYRFDVTLYHDDDGEAGYADWWQVETWEGERLGRRELLHAHGTRPFTRSATVDVPPEADCVVVRGHDQTHGYGGRAMLVDPVTGATRSVDQGSESRSMAEEPCP